MTPARFGVWEDEVALVPARLRSRGGACGRAAVLVPPSDDGVEETLDALDGVIFSGGSDLDPELYGQDPHPETKGVVPERDRAELALLQAALARDMPVLAICRGSQVLNVAAGGDLVQHLPDDVGHDGHKHTPGVFADHDVVIEQGTRLGELLGGHAPVKSHHHQGFGRLGSGLRVSAHADDGAVEAVEDPSRRFALGVLWHPEAGEDLQAVRGARRGSGSVPLGTFLNRADYGGAERAARRGFGDLAQALRARPRRHLDRQLCAPPLHQRIDRLHRRGRR